MKISFLQAGNGDCIHIESEEHHVIIDSGEVCNELVSVVESIKAKKEVIDLLVITHYDTDHIKAINTILENLNVEDRKKLVKKVWFNATKVGFHGNEKLLSEQDATKLAYLLLEADINWISELRTGEIEKNDCINTACNCDRWRSSALFFSFFVRLTSSSYHYTILQYVYLYENIVACMSKFVNALRKISQYFHILYTRARVKTNIWKNFSIFFKLFFKKLLTNTYFYIIL
jgi:hypothetical protein